MYNWRGTIAKNTLVVSLTTSRDWFFSPVETVRPGMPLNTPRPTIDYYSYMGMLQYNILLLFISQCSVYERTIFWEGNVSFVKYFCTLSNVKSCLVLSYFLFEEYPKPL